MIKDTTIAWFALVCFLFSAISTVAYIDYTSDIQMAKRDKANFEIGWNISKECLERDKLSACFLQCDMLRNYKQEGCRYAIEDYLEHRYG